PRPDTNPDTTLYTWLKRQGAAFTIAHTPTYATDQKRGTWSYNDPEVEPVAEIFQAYRVPYEQPSGRGQDYRSLWHALSKGYKLGFIASSDHHSTHMSYACVFAEGPTRAHLFDAIKQRRTYAAMDKIFLDVRMGEEPMGSILDDQPEPTLEVAIRGTAPIARADIVRDGRFVYTLEDKPANYHFDYADNNPPSTSSYYYVRVEQTDGAIAWGSPIWVER
ncbi:MAG: hypothetical protein GY953_34745, partial [bacterium]|nr:hypothetical protein [bacterium]